MRYLTWGFGSRMQDATCNQKHILCDVIIIFDYYNNENSLIIISMIFLSDLTAGKIKVTGI